MADEPPGKRLCFTGPDDAPSFTPSAADRTLIAVPATGGRPLTLATALTTFSPTTLPPIFTTPISTTPTFTTLISTTPTSTTPTSTILLPPTSTILLPPTSSTVFPYPPYHFRWRCAHPKTKFERNGIFCSTCVCYICNIVLTECTHASHKWAVPPDATVWVNARGGNKTSEQMVLPTRPLQPQEPIHLPSHLPVIRLSIPVRVVDHTCVGMFGVPAAVFQAYLYERVGEYLWAGLRQVLQSWQIPIGPAELEFLDQLCQAKHLKWSRRWVGHMVRPTKLNPSKATHVFFHCPTDHELAIEVHVQQYQTVFLQPMACQLLFRHLAKLPAVVDVPFPSPVLTRPLLPHQERSLERMVAMERHGLTPELWDTLAATPPDKCVYSNYILHAWHVAQRTATFVAPDAICRGGLLCNDRGTGKTYISVALMVAHPASSDWLATVDTVLPATMLLPPLAVLARPPAPAMPDDEDSDVEDTADDSKPPRKLPPTVVATPVSLPTPSSATPSTVNANTNATVHATTSANATATDYGVRLARWHADFAVRVPTTLVVVPGANLLTQWAEEIAYAGLRVKTFHGAAKQKTVTAEQLLDVDVLLTTTDTLRINLTQGKTPLDQACQPTSVFARVRFWRIVVDECHKLFQSSTLTSTGAALAWVRAHQRWGLTATPGATMPQCRAYLQFLYGCPTQLTAAHNLVHHYVAYPQQYTGDAYRTVHQTQFFPAITVQERSAAGQLPTVVQHSHGVVPDGGWLGQYKKVITTTQAILKHGTYGPRVLHLLNNLLLCLTGATAMVFPKLQDFQAMATGTNDDKTPEVPPDIFDCCICLEELVAPVRSTCMHYFCQTCIRRWMQQNPTTRCPLCRSPLREPLTVCQTFVPILVTPDVAADQQQLECFPLKMQEILRNVMLLASTDNTQLPTLAERLPNRILIFSRFPQVRAILYAALHDAVRVAENVQEFQNDPTFAILILSFQSCGVGLNLMQANHVVLTEPAFREDTRVQAYGRAARMGQQRTVHVHQFFVTDTIEEHLLQQSKKNKICLKDVFVPNA